MKPGCVIYKHPKFPTYPLPVPLRLVLVCIVLLFFIFGHDSRSSLSLLLFDLLHLRLPQSSQPISRTRQPADLIRNLSPTNETDHDTRSHNECKDESIRHVPVRRPAPNASSGVGEVQERKGGELGNQGVFDWEKEGWPCHSRGKDAVCVSSIAVLTAVFGPL